MTAQILDGSRSQPPVARRDRTAARASALPGRKPGVCALHETIAAARPALLAALHRVLPATPLVIIPTPDAAERAFADLLYYFGEGDREIALCVRATKLRARSRAHPSEARASTLLDDLRPGGAASCSRRSPRCGSTLCRVALRERRVVLRAGRRGGFRAPARAALRAWVRALRRRERRRRVCRARRHRRSLCGGRRRAGAHRVLWRRIESIRTFAIESQRSRDIVEESKSRPGTIPAKRLDHLRLPSGDALVVLDDPATLAAVAERSTKNARASATRFLREDPRRRRVARRRGGAASLADVGRAIAPYAALLSFRARSKAARPRWIGRRRHRIVGLRFRPVEHFNRQIGLLARRCASGRRRRKRLHRERGGLAHDRRPARGRHRSRGARRGGVFVDHGSIEAGFSIPSHRTARARRPRNIRRPAQTGEDPRGQRGRSGHAGRLASRRLRRARGARDRAIPRSAGGDDPRRDPGLPGPPLRGQRPDAGAGHADASGRKVRRGRRAGAAPLQDGRRRLGAREIARLRSACKDRRRARRALCRA